jgi:glycosyltransferase involved in cell wall biosynthesis
MKVTHIITGLSTGGAELMLVKLLRELRNSGPEATVVSLSGEAAGPAADDLRQLGVPLVELGIRSAAGTGMGVLALARLLRRERPSVIQGWMYHANLFATGAGVVSGHNAPVMWNIRASLPAPGEEKLATSIAIRVGGLLSRQPARILYNSQIAARQHEGAGYDATRTVVIPNGFDTVKFWPDRRAREQLRREWGIVEGLVLVGHVARYHPMKDHLTFLRAFASAARDIPALRAVMAGKGVDFRNVELAGLVRELGLANRVTMLGERRDIPAIASAFDLFVSSSSRQEGFSNVLGEAMACGVPCLATDVGDAAWIVGDTGVVVPPRDPERLASAIVEQARLGSVRLREKGDRARARVIENFAISAVAKRYSDLYDTVTRKLN